MLQMQSQSITPEWTYALKGFQDVDPAGIETDSSGGVYVAGIYSGWLEVPGLKERFQAPNHVGGYLIRIDHRGKTKWALPFLSSKDSRINTLNLLPNKRVAVAGFCDSCLILPSIDGKTVKFGGRNACFIAVYDSLGRLQWSHFQQSSWGEATCLASDVSGNIYYTGYFRRGFEGANIVLPDSAASTSEFLIKYSPSGQIIWQHYFKSTLQEHYYEKKPNVFTSADGRICFTSLLTKGHVLHCAGGDMHPIDALNRHSGYVLCLNEAGDVQWIRHYGGFWAQQIQDATFTPRGDFLFTVDFGSEFYIGDDSQPLPEHLPEKPASATSGFAWVRLDVQGELLDLDFHTGKTGAFGTRSRFIEMLPDDAYVMGGEFTNTLDFADRNPNETYIKGQLLNHNGWQAAFLEDGTVESLWKTVHTEKGFSFPFAVSCRASGFSSVFMCYEEQEVQLNGEMQSIPKAERARFTLITSGKIERKKPETLNPLLACNEAILVNELRKIEKTDQQILQEFLSDSGPGALLASASKNNINESDTVQQENRKRLRAFLYPNPAKETTKVSVYAESPFLSLGLYSASGCLLRKDIRRSDSGVFEVDIALGHLPAGIYLLFCEAGEFREAFRIVHVY